mgnify:CR=1 FL=1
MTAPARTDQAPALKDVMRLVLLAGKVLVESGANASRSEETIMRLGLSCGADTVDVYCTLTGFFVTVVRGDEVLTRVVSMRSHGTDLGRIAEVQEMSMALERGSTTCDATINQLKAMILNEASVGYSPRVRLLGSAVSCGAFAVLLGGGPADFIPALLAGLFAQVVCSKIRRTSPEFVAIFFSVMIGTLGAVVASRLGLGSLRYITVGVIMPMVPGLAVTNSVRDLIFGDLLSGLSRWAEALLSAAAIAGGVYAVLAAFRVDLWI